MKSLRPDINMGTMFRAGGESARFTSLLQKSPRRRDLGLEKLVGHLV